MNKFTVELNIEPCNPSRDKEIMDICSNCGFTFYCDTRRCLSVHDAGPWLQMIKLQQLISDLELHGYSFSRYVVKRIS